MVAVKSKKLVSCSTKYILSCWGKKAPVQYIMKSRDKRLTYLLHKVR